MSSEVSQRTLLSGCEGGKGVYSFLTLFFLGSLRLVRFLWRNLGRKRSQFCTRSSGSLDSSRLIISVWRSGEQSGEDRVQVVRTQRRDGGSQLCWSPTQTERASADSRPRLRAEPTAFRPGEIRFSQEIEYKDGHYLHRTWIQNTGYRKKRFLMMNQFVFCPSSVLTSLRFHQTLKCDKWT